MKTYFKILQTLGAVLIVAGLALMCIPPTKSHAQLYSSVYLGTNTFVEVKGSVGVTNETIAIRGVNLYDSQTLTTTTSGGYTAGDSWVTNYVTLTNIFREPGGSAYLNGIRLVSNDDTAPALLIGFCVKPPTLEADANAAASVTSTLQSEIKFSVSVASTDWVDWGTNRVYDSTFSTKALVNQWTNRNAYIVIIANDTTAVTNQPTLTTLWAY